MNRGNTPPGDERDSASARNPAAAKPTDPSALRPASSRPTIVASTDPQATKHRIGSGLPVQPPPLATARRPLRPSPPFLGSTKGTLGSATSLPGSTSAIDDDDASTPSAAMAKLATPLYSGSKIAGRPDPAAKVQPSVPGASMSVRAKTEQVKAEIAKVVPPRPDATPALSPALARLAGTGFPSSSTTGRIAPGAGDPEQLLSGRPTDGHGASLMEQRRITPRSPRAALQPENVPPPKRLPEPSRPSRRARNPLVIVGNAIFTLLILALLVGGGAIVVGKSRFEAPGPLAEDKVVTIPPRSGMMEIADLLQREGVIDEHRLVFAGGVLAMKARSGLKAGEYLFQKHASVRDVVETIVDGKVVQHQLTDSGRLDLRADRRAAPGERFALRQHQGSAARRQPVAGQLLLPSRLLARADDRAHASGAGSPDAGSLGAPQSRSAGAHARTAAHPRVDHREGNRQA